MHSTKHFLDHITNEGLYGHFPKVCRKIRERRMRVAGHCDRHGEEEEASKLVLWQPQHRQTKRGTYTVAWRHRFRHHRRTQNGNVKPMWLERENPTVVRAGARTKLTYIPSLTATFFYKKCFLHNRCVFFLQVVMGGFWGDANLKGSSPWPPSLPFVCIIFWFLKNSLKVCLQEP